MDQNVSEILKKKGAVEIISELLRSEQYYNELRSILDKKISNRTLDQLLKLLQYNELIEKLPTSWEDSPHEIYSLTKKGIEFISLMHPLNEIYNKKIQGEDFREKMCIFSLQAQTKYEFYLNRQKFLFSNIWPLLLRIIEKKKRIYTYPQKKINEIALISTGKIKIWTEKGTETISINEIRRVWNNLLIDGKLKKNDYQKSSYRSSFILSLFLELDFIRIIHEEPLIIGLNDYSPDFEEK